MATLEIAVVGGFVSALLLSGLRAWFLPVALLVILTGAVAAGIIGHWSAWRTFVVLGVSAASMELGYLGGTFLRSLSLDIKESGVRLRLGNIRGWFRADR